MLAIRPAHAILPGSATASGPLACIRRSRMRPWERNEGKENPMKRARLVPAVDLPELPTALPPWPGEEVALDGTVTYVRHTPATGPDAEPALYVHGLGGSSLNWTDLAFLLAGRLEGEAIDLPGFGRSGPGRNYQVYAMADRVIRWIEHSGRGPVHLFGNSLGGAITVWVAGTRPDLVRTLTLVSPAMPFMDP